MSQWSLKWKLIFWLTLSGFLVSFCIHLSLFLLGASDINVGMRQSPIQNWNKKVIEQPIQAIILDGKLMDSIEKIEVLLVKLIDKKAHKVLHRKTPFTSISIISYAIVDSQSKLISQSKKSYFKAGDLGHQIAIQSRDDLSDALMGRNNSGIERIEDQKYLIIKPVKNNQDLIIGALLMFQEWYIPTNHRPLFYISIPQAMLATLGYTLSSFLWIVPSTIILGFIVARVINRKLAPFNRTVSSWEQGDFSLQLNQSGGDEISASFRRLNSMSQKLKAHQEKLTIMAGLQERQQLASELHDTVKQQLFAANLNLSAAQMQVASRSSEASQTLEKCITQNQKAFSQINQLIFSLNPFQIGNDLKSAIVKVCKDFKEDHDIDTKLQVSVPPTLTEVQQQTIFGCVKEGLQNIVKHSKSKEASINLIERDDRLDLQIINITLKSKGTGIKLGYGLNIMKNRVEMLNGRLNVFIESDGKQNMFIIEASIPL